MFSNDSQELLKDASRITQDLSRQLASPKKDVDDLYVLSETLEILSRSVRTVADTERDRLKYR